MADQTAEVAEGSKPSDAGGAVTRPDYIPETAWDAEKNAPSVDFGTVLTEHQTLKAAADDRAKLIPAKADDYKFELPKEFKLPEGYKWQADPKDPVITGFRTLASELKLTQPEVERLVQFEATRQAGEIKAQKDFDAEQTKALGANADQRRKAASDWIDGAVKNKGAASVLKTMLSYALGVEGIEAIIDAAKVSTRGNVGDHQDGDAKKAELKEGIGKPGGASAILRAAFSGK